MDSSASCPFCYLTLPLSQLQWHANSHFEDENDDQILQEARDRELAQQIASSSSSSTVNTHKEVDTKPSESQIDEKISCLISLQMRSFFYQVDGGLMLLLRNCLELDTQNTTSILSGHVDHFQCIASEDVGWGCGWRNIQMLSSHLLFHRPDAREVLFGGSRFVPDIPFLQQWLEVAWERGFDGLGSHHFNHSIYGSSHWIGTTECAALFRSFGLRARIVDFGLKNFDSLFLSVPHVSRGTSTRVQVLGPMDRYLLPRKPDVSQSHGDNTTDNSGKKSERCQIFMDWVLNYFSDQSLNISHHHGVIISKKTPLYFQHDGHSRTIVGIQAKCLHNGMRRYNLLVLDPAHRTVVLEKALKQNAGWQKLIQRGVHTLKKPQYQLCYIDPGIASMEEVEQLKSLNSVFIEF